jgi:hypothetical protein
MYKLQVASNFKYCEVLFLLQLQPLVYLLTPIFPYSPIKSSTNLTFFFVVFGSLIGRLFYVRLQHQILYANHILICEKL